MFYAIQNSSIFNMQSFYRNVIICNYSDALQARAATGFTFWHLFFFDGRQNLRKLDLIAVLSAAFFFIIYPEISCPIALLPKNILVWESADKTKPFRILRTEPKNSHLLTSRWRKIVQVLVETSLSHFRILNIRTIQIIILN